MIQQRPPRRPLARPIAKDIVECAFRASHDGSEQTFLLKDFRSVYQSTPPLLAIYLHGATFHQDQGMTSGIYGDAFNRLAKEEWITREAVYICPEYRGSSWMSAAAEADLLDIFQWAIEELRPRQILLMGGSMGGTSALSFAALHPTLMSGVLALCPATDMAEMYPRFSQQFLSAYGGSPEEKPDEYRQRSSRYYAAQLATLPIAIVHGTKDTSIPIHHARLLVQELQKLNAPLLYHEIENGDHNAPIHIPLQKFIDFALHGRTT
jgi:dipeptidyl aminopeptidase/acylaminoacyl peptidase